MDKNLHCVWHLTKTLFLGIDTNNTAAATNSMFNMKGGLHNKEEIKMNFRLLEI